LIVLAKLPATHHQWFALPHEPEVFVKPRLVQIPVNFPQYLLASLRHPERQHESDLRRLNPVLPGFVPNFAELHVRFLPFEIAVGTVEHDHVDACFRQHFSMFAEYPFVGIPVVSEQRFTPQPWRIFLGPDRILGVVNSLWVSCQVFGYVQRSIFAKAALLRMPGPVKNPDIFVFSRCTGLLMTGKRSADCISSRNIGRLYEMLREESLG